MGWIAVALIALVGCKGEMGAQGTTGPAGAQGAVGSTGAQGTGLSSLVFFFDEFTDTGSGAWFFNMPCPLGQTPISGGWGFDRTNLITVTRDSPVDNGGGVFAWEVIWENTSGVPATISETVGCIDAPGSIPPTMAALGSPGMSAGPVAQR